MKTSIKRTIHASVLSLFLIGVCALGQGTILWDESSNGPLSQDFNNPSLLGLLQAGTNSIVGATESIPNGNNWTTYPDIFVISVPANLTVSSIRLQINKNNIWAWLGDQTYLNTLGFAMNPTNGDLLSQLGFGSVRSGTYGMYLDNHDLQSVTSIANYRLDFFLQSIPEPTSTSLVFLGFGCLGLRLWRKVRPSHYN